MEISILTAASFVSLLPLGLTMSDPLRREKFRSSAERDSQGGRHTRPSARCCKQPVMVDAACGAWRGRKWAKGHCYWIALFSAAAGALLVWRGRRQAVRELSTLDERTLRDIGIDPATVLKVVKTGDLRAIVHLPYL